MAQEEERLDPWLLNTFLISDHRCRVYFHRDVLIWEKENSTSERHVVPASDIIAVNYGSCDCSESRAAARISDADGLTSSGINSCKSLAHNSMVIHYAERKEKNKWRISTVSMRHGDERQISSWVKTLNNSLAKKNRPKNFLVLVNPFCGKRKGVEIYEKTVRPILDLARIEKNVTVTEHGNHLKEIILSTEVEKYDGIMAVGGDGTLSEIVNALILRTMRDHGKDRNDRHEEIPGIDTPIAVIPGGSTDCIAYCLNGTSDRKTAAIYAVLGDRSGLDVCSVHSSSGLCRYFLSLLGYGFLGDVLKESEKHRWMGPKRYDYAGFLKVLKNRRYYCEITMTKSPGRAGTGPKCRDNCQVCKEPVEVRKESKTRYRESNLAAIRNELKLDSEEKKIPEREEVTVRGKYFIVGCANISCACERSPNGVAPHCHIGDGSMNVLLFKPRNLVDVLRLLLRSKSKNENEALSDLPFIEIYKASELKVKALDKNLEALESPELGGRCPGASVWNCDGELVPDSNLFVKNYRQLIRVFTRRWIPPAKSDSFSCFGCYVCSGKSSNELI